MVELIIAIVLFIVLIIVSGFLYKCQTRYTKLLGEHGTLINKNEKLSNEHSELISAKELIVEENSNLSDSCTKLADRIDTLQVNRDEIFESVKERDKVIDDYEEFIQLYSENLTLVEKHMTKIDNRGMFAADDEVGYVYKTIRLLVSNLQKFNTDNAEAVKVGESKVGKEEKA